MRRIPSQHLIASCALALTLAGVSQAAAIPAKDRMLIVISLDGFPAYDLADSKLPIPTLRQLMASGSSAKSMQPVNPTWTWPNHTTMVTGVGPAEHGVLYNGELIRNDDPLSVKIDPSIPKDKMVLCETLYDVAFRSGLTTAQVDWVAINDAPTITWAFPEQAKPSDPLVKEMVAKGVLRDSDIGSQDHPTILWRDQIWTKAGTYLIREHKPNLLLFHLLSLDSAHHAYAPRTLASYAAIAFLDGCVKQLLDAVKDAGMLDRTTFFVVSDHGFKAVEKQIGLLNVLAAGALGENVRAVAEGGSAMIFVAKEHRSELLAKVRLVFSATEGVDLVVDEAEYPSLGYPLPSKNPQMPDMLILAKPGYAFSTGKNDNTPVVVATGHPTGAHGYLNTDPELQAIFIASGYGIIKGVALGEIQNTALAPTLARLLGIPLPKAEGSALKQILQSDLQQRP